MSRPHLFPPPSRVIIGVDAALEINGATTYTPGPICARLFDAHDETRQPWSISLTREQALELAVELMRRI